MTTKEIQQLVAKTQVNKGHILVCENLSNYFPYCEADVVSVTSAGFVHEFEVKVTRADYKADSDKVKKHKAFEMSPDLLANYFSYVCPRGLIKASEVPQYAGLYYVDGDKLFEVVKPPCIHKTKHDLLKLSLKINKVTIERLYLGGCKLTVKNNSIKAKRKTKLEEAGFSEKEIKQYLKQK